jgi:hypothetical protein
LKLGSLTDWPRRLFLRRPQVITKSLRKNRLKSRPLSLQRELIEMIYAL